MVQVRAASHHPGYRRKTDLCQMQEPFVVERLLSGTTSLLIPRGEDITKRMPNLCTGTATVAKVLDRIGTFFVGLGPTRGCLGGYAPARIADEPVSTVAPPMRSITGRCRASPRARRLREACPHSGQLGDLRGSSDHTCRLRG